FTMKTLLWPILIFVLTSCASRQWVGKNADLFNRREIGTPPTADSIFLCHPKGYARAFITIKDEQVTLKVDTAHHKKIGTCAGDTIKNTTTGFEMNAPSYYYPEQDWKGEKNPAFVYTEGQLFLQPLTIALKFREEAIRDTI